MTIEAVPTSRALVGTAVTLTYQHRSSDGEPATPTGTPTVSVADSTGTAVTVGSVSDDGDGSYSAIVAATDNPTTDIWSQTWSVDGADRVQTTAVVGATYVSTGEIRDLEPSLDDGTKYPTAGLLATRTIAEWEVERITNRAFVPRFRVAELAGSASDLVLPEWDVRTIRWISSVDPDGTVTPWTVDELANVQLDGSAGVIVSGRSWRRVRIGFEYGLDYPPEDIRRAVVKRIRWFANRPTSTIPDRATSYSVDGGTYRIQTANRDRTGDDDVDAVYQSWSRRDVGVA